MAHWNARAIPDLNGSTAVVTGANAGIGKVMALYLARAGVTTILACRDETRGQLALDTVRAAAPGADVRLVRLDLADLESVRAAAGEITQTVDGRLDLLINNAGVMALPLRRTVDGFEMQFGTNHLGHFALTGHLLPCLGVTAPARVVAVSSLVHRYARMDFDDLNSERDYQKWKAYGQSKLANLLFVDELDRRAAQAGRQLTALAAHPGVSATELGTPRTGGTGRTLRAKLDGVRRLCTQPASVGALPVLRAATDPHASGGGYFGPRGPLEIFGQPAPAKRSPRSLDQTDASTLWEFSAELTGVVPDFERRLTNS